MAPAGDASTSLLRNAESDYTRRMRWFAKGRCCGFAWLLLCAWVCSTAAATPASGKAERDPHELYNTLNALRVDPSAVYRIEVENRVLLRRGDASLSFEEGKLGLFFALDGKISGAVFSGRGHALAAPRDPVEKQQIALFLGATVLDEDFTSAYLRFTDATAEDLLAQLRDSKIAPETDSAFAEKWATPLALFNPEHSLRILDAELTHNAKPYFFAGVDGVTSGPFDVFYDLLRTEPFVLGQPRRGNGPGAADYYDVWVSYALPGDPVPVASVHAENYAIDTKIELNKTLEATADIDVSATKDGDRLLVFALARTLAVDRVSDDQGVALPFFQNEGMSEQAREERGEDALYVVLPPVVEAAQRFHLHFHYRGNVIKDAGNEVLVVGARDSWYPHLGDTADFAQYELTMRWPRKMQLVATGTKVDERIDGEYTVGRWGTDHPISVAGFNLGEYASAAVSAPAYSVEIFANRKLEQELSARLSSSAGSASLGGMPPGFRRGASAERGDIGTGRFGDTAPPSPADTLKQLAKEIDGSIRYYEKFGGPFPYRSLSVSQIPGNFGQGWPGLLYLSTYAYLSPEAQRRAGLSVSGQEHFTQLVPYHEVAHQWWGNVVGWSSYRDQWIDEAIASYLALMFADSQKPQDHELRVWLDRFRKSLLVKTETTDQETPAENGALTLGSRLNSSKAPRDYEVMIYSKGSWVLHMIREMLLQPKAEDPDERFTLLLRTLSRKYAYRALSTADLQKEVEAVMSPAMDLEGGRSMEWFFDEWIRGTGIPHYRVEYTSKIGDGNYLIKGTLQQTGVPRSFIAPVPIYASIGAGHTVYLGTVTAEGAKTTFHFTTPSLPHKLLIDPQNTLLCVTE